jgi:hypothetical protein
VSHLKERKENNCLNCNAEVYGRYCHICGQENVELKESFWGLATHLIYDIMHFDSKFFDTLKYLLFKPGFLTREYLRGRRASYLHPIRMYVFTSAIFFIIFFSFIITTTESNESNKGEKTIHEQIQVLQDSLKKVTNTVERNQIEHEISGLKMASAYIPASESVKTDSGGTVGKTEEVLKLREDMPSSIPKYDSLQKKLPIDARDGLFMRAVMHHTIEINAKYKGDTDRFKEDFAEKFKHSIPQMMFVSLPLVALVLQLLFVRRRKQFIYVDHVIFIIHTYIAVFISLLIFYALSGLHDATGFAPFSWLATVVGIYISLYCILAMRRFYQQGIVKTVLKYFILLIISGILTSLLMGILFVTSFLQI